MNELEPTFTPEEIERAKLYTTHVTHEIEKSLIEEIEKIEGRVPDNVELHQYGRQVLHKDLSMDYTWKSMLIVSVKPHHVEGGEKGMLITVHKHGVDKSKEDE